MAYATLKDRLRQNWKISVIIDPQGNHIAECISYEGTNSETTTVEVRNFYPANRRPGCENLQRAKRCGCGYDKELSGIDGMVIDGITLFEGGRSTAESQAYYELYCDAIATVNALAAYPEGFEAMDAAQKELDRVKTEITSQGFDLYGWNCELDQYMQCYPTGGLDRLTRFGYKVIKIV